MNVRLIIPGEPKGKGRPKFVKATGRAYTPADTRTAEQRVQGEWIAAGRPELGPGPLGMRVTAVMGRPKAHVRADGTLSTAGRRSVWPVKRPDIDNLLKLALDSLNGLAFVDDAQVVSEATWKRWTRPGEQPHLHIELWTYPGELQEDEVA